MTENTFKTDSEASENTEQGNFSTGTDQVTDKKSVEGQLAVVQKRLDDGLQFIDTLKKENQEYREKLSSYEQMSSVNDKVDQLLSRMNETSQQDEAGQQTQVNVIEDLKSQGFLTKDDLERQAREARQAENFNKVKSALINSYGEEKFMDSLQTKASELGMTLEDVDVLAQNNPNAAIKLFGTEKSSTVSSTQGSINTQAFDKLNNETPAKPKSVMFGATTDEVVSTWRQAGEIVKQQLETQGF